MIFDNLVITNFKSYKGTHAVGPLDKFSCIIGPNGSGKSNILDAISFVLNVPNNFLRVKNLKNLVEYNSTEASVRIQINDITFERKIFKSVDNSESIILENDLNQDMTYSTSCKYYLNGVKISQKEYNKELENLNILSKIKNFVIYQGDIIKTEIDLLKMIENVCGSESYIEEYNKLNEKIGIMNKSLCAKYENRKGCLELMKEIKEGKDKEKAFETLIAKKEEIQKKIYEFDIKNKILEIERVKESLKGLEEMKEDEKYEKANSLVNKIRSETATLQKEYFEKDNELTLLKSKQSNKSLIDIDSKQAELKDLVLRHSNTKEELERLPFPINFDENTKFEGEVLTKEKFEQILKEKEIEYSQKITGLEKQLSELVLLNFDKINRRDYLKSTIRQISLKKSKLVARNTQIEKENKEKLEKMRGIDREIQILESQIQNKTTAYERIISDEEKLNKELNDVMKDILLNKAKKNDITKRSMVKNVVESLKTIFSGVHGRVIDLIQPIQKKYELSVGVLLSKHDQSVIVDNEKTALDCLRYIKEAKSCKLTFLPLNKIKGFNIEPENLKNINLSTNDYSNQLARNCISYSPEYSNIIDFIFKNSLIVDDINMAKDILYNKKYPGNICTIDSVLFSPKGLITGGKSTVNKFEDDIIDRLLSKRKVILDNIKINKDRKEAFSDVSTVILRIEELKKKKESIKLDKIELEMLKEFNTNVYEAELEDIENTLIEFERQQKEIKELKKKVEKNVLGKLLRTVGIDTYSEFKERIKQDYRRQELQIRLETIKDKIGLLNEEITIYNTTQENIKVKDTTDLQKEIDSLYKNLEVMKDKLKTENQILKGYTDKRNQINTSILNHTLHLTRIEEDLKDLIKYAELECNINVEDLINSKDDKIIEDITQLRNKLAEINRSIGQNAPMVSIADSSLQSKYSKMNREYEIAKEELLVVKRQFQEVKRKRMDIFINCFTAISQNISEIYRELAKGDFETNSYLIYEGDPFVNNIKYYLMPPGKGFVPFNELSGGERSLALLSFIFALSKYRKPPFYIFDEVDSALDKVNVDSLSSFIQKSADQFLVVSLKPQFFSKSQSLFGVYKCPNDNTSKILSLKLAVE